MVVAAAKEEEVPSSGGVYEFEVEYYLSKFGSYYFFSVCSKFQDGLVILFSVVVGIE